MNWPVGMKYAVIFDQVMRQRFLPSGRVTYLPLSNYTDDGIVTSLATGKRTLVKARKKTVDVTLADTRVPSTHPPSFSVAPGVRCVPPNALVQLKEPCAGFVIIGAGKTSIDTIIWLLEQGIDPQTIIWIRPRDQWLMNRKGFQIGYDLFLLIPMDPLHPNWSQAVMQHRSTICLRDWKRRACLRASIHASSQRCTDVRSSAMPNWRSFDE